jgi:hypothetical protein
LGLTGIRLSFAWDDVIRLDVQVSVLWQAVIANVVFAIARTDGLAVCTACGRAYSPLKRRPQSGRRNYCPDCKNARWRDSKRDQRARKANARRGTDG